MELIEATAEIANSVPRLRVVLVGTSSSGSRAYASQVRERVMARGLFGKVLILENHGHDQIADLLRASDVYVQPSHVEGLGLAVLEAMACGVPVVASDADGFGRSSTPAGPVCWCRWATRRRWLALFFGCCTISGCAAGWSRVVTH